MPEAVAHPPSAGEAGGGETGAGGWFAVEVRQRRGDPSQLQWPRSSRRQAHDTLPHGGSFDLSQGVGTVRSMGRNNKERRNAKARAAKAKAKGWSGGGGSWWRRPVEGDPLFTESELARQLLLFTAESPRGGGPLGERGVGRLVSLPSEVVDREAEDILLDQVTSIWAGGWQPSELHRQGRRGCDRAAAGRLVSTAIAVDHLRRRPVELDQRWSAQVEELDLPAVDGGRGWIRRWAAAEGLDRGPTVAAVVDAIANLLHLPRLQPIIPPPGPIGSGRRAPWAATDVGVGAETDPVLERIRGLLAKAESSTFEAEATAFTAKAQELMTRHAVDAAMVQGRSQHEQPVAVRVAIDAPYADVKSLLLQTVAEQSRCRAVFHVKFDLSTVVGFPGDVAGVEVLFTSLLLQAQKALTDAAKRAPSGTRTRSQSYRSTFLLAYTDRVRERLRESNETVLAEVESERGGAFLPVLRARSEAVDDFLSERFGETVSSRVRGGYDAAGWASGRLAADRAQIAFGDLEVQAAAGP